jgi:hypothetical protein
MVFVLEKTFDEKLHEPAGGYRQSFSGSIEQCLSIVRTFESCDSLAIHPEKAIAKGVPPCHKMK